MQYYKLRYRQKWFLFKHYEEITKDDSMRILYILHDVVEVSKEPKNFDDAAIVMEYSVLECYKSIIESKANLLTIDKIVQTETNAQSPKRTIFIGRNYPAMWAGIDPYMENPPVTVIDFPPTNLKTFEADVHKMKEMYDQITGRHPWLEPVFSKPLESPMPESSTFIDDDEVTRVCQPIIPTDKSVIDNKLKEVTDEINSLIKSKKDDHVRAKIKRLRDIQTRLKSWQT